MADGSRRARPWRTTLARHAPRSLRRYWSDRTDPPSPSAGAAASDARVNREYRRAIRPDRYWRRGPSNCTKEVIFFRPMPGVAESSASGVPSKSRERAGQEGQRQTPVGRQCPIGQRFVEMLGIPLREKKIPQAFETRNDLQFLNRGRVVESHHVLPAKHLREPYFSQKTIRHRRLTLVAIFLHPR